MISEERVKLMARLALLQRQEDRRSMEIDRYRRKDYIWLNIARTVIFYTLAAAIIIALCFVCLLMQPGAWTMRQFVLAVVIALILYLAGAFIAGLVAYGLSDARYQEAEQKVRNYDRMLHSLNRLYHKEKQKGSGG